LKSLCRGSNDRTSRCHDAPNSKRPGRAKLDPELLGDSLQP
jgi:hypothetical protein